MRDLGIPIDPVTFTVWYEYYRGDNLDLKHAVNKLLRSDAEPSRADCLELHSRFLGNHDNMDETAEQIRVAIEAALSSIGDAGKQNAAFGLRLGSISGDLVDCKDSRSVGSIVASLLRETEKTVRRSRDLEEQLSSASGEIRLLKDNLADLHVEASTDALTGLANRKHFDKQLKSEIDEATTTDSDLALLMIDIDHFKSFNDRFGHAIGDEVLKVVASTIRRSVKGRDTAARYGGEEFCVILPQTDLNGAIIVADQIRLAVSSRPLTHRTTQQDFGRITLSAGVARFRTGESMKELVERSDKALYKAKEKGRNRVEDETALD
ncbi:GGDEF domain-containing protein [Oceanibacterium hippocampi]|uniref:GGDEF domain-containing protein n=1 Tax=Oceanibacterium hippocampi TaxID=745714 RepID=UPI000A26ABE0|nr:diguanylate cyclase [Oceanibacterium hippocampi]